MGRTRLILGITFLIAVSGILVLLINSRQKSDNSPEVIKVAIVLPLHLETGQDMLHAAELALAEHNDQAGNIRVELVAYNIFSLDDAAERRMQERVVREIIADESVVAVIGASFSEDAIFMVPILNPVPLVMISPTATWPGLTKAGFGAGEPGVYYPTGQRNFFRVIPSDDVQGLAAIRWMQRQGVRRIFIVTPDAPYSVGLSGIVQANAEDFGLEIVGYEIYNPDSASSEANEALISRVEAAHPDLLYYPIPGTVRGYDLIAILYERLPEVLIMGGDGLVSESVPEGMVLPAQIYATNVVDAAYLESAVEFVSAYQEAYGKTPPPFALTTYESIGVILQAIESADSASRIDVLRALHAIENYTGAMGVWHFDPNGDTSLTTIGIMQLQGGTWEVVGVIE